MCAYLGSCDNRMETCPSHVAQFGRERKHNALGFPSNVDQGTNRSIHGPVPVLGPAIPHWGCAFLSLLIKRCLVIISAVDLLAEHNVRMAITRHNGQKGHC